MDRGRVEIYSRESLRSGLGRDVTTLSSEGLDGVDGLEGSSVRHLRTNTQKLKDLPFPT